MLKYKGFDIPETKEEIMEENNRCNPNPMFTIPTVMWRGEFKTPISTRLTIEDISIIEREPDIENVYIRIIKEYIDMITKDSSDNTES